MLMSKNVNNDVSKDSPIAVQDHLIVCFQLMLSYKPHGTLLGIFLSFAKMHTCEFNKKQSVQLENESKYVL